VRLPKQSENSIGVFALVGGVLLGALLMAVVVPRSTTKTVVTERGGSDRSSFSAGSEGPTEGTDGTLAADSGTGSSAPGSGGGDTGTGGGTPTGQAAQGGTEGPSPVNVRGVSDDTVRIGVTYPDLAGLRSLGPEYDNGDVPKQWRALLERWKRERKSPVAGRNIEFVFRTYPVLDTASQRAACAGLIQDDKVFAVVGVAYFQVGTECVVREFNTPLIGSDGATEAVFARSNGNLISLYLSQDAIIRNWAKFAADQGFVRGKNVGIYHLTTGIDPEMAKLFKSELEKNGAAKVVIATTDQSLGGPNDALAAQKFRAEGVKTAFVLTSKSGFMQQAQAQGYKPQYVESDYLFGSADSTQSTDPPEQADGMIGITVTHNGEAKAGIKPPAGEQACIDNYKQVTGEQPNPPGSAEYNYIKLSCDLGTVLLHGLNAAARYLTPQTLIAGVESLRTTETLQIGGLAYSKNRHWGADRARTIQWHGDCKCWKATGGYYPLPVP
jgi:ABC-type branched-subunit amino acid transport system substrate-binding protein